MQNRFTILTFSIFIGITSVTRASIGASDLATPPSVKHDPQEFTKQALTKLIDAADIESCANTGSMKPTFDENYYLITQVIPYEDVKEGMVAIYRPKVPVVRNGITYTRICHRIIIEIKDTDYKIMKGDANLDPDIDCLTRANYDCVIVGWIRKDVSYRYFTSEFKIQ